MGEVLGGAEIVELRPLFAQAVPQEGGLSSTPVPSCVYGSENMYKHSTPPNPGRNLPNTVDFIRERGVRSLTRDPPVDREQ